MTVQKKVAFIERIDKSRLGLKGLQYVVYCDKCRNKDASKEEIINDEYNFCTIGKKMLESIDGKYIQEKYKIKPSIALGNKLHEERVVWLRNIEKGME